MEQEGEELVTVYVCPACGEQNREGRYCAKCGCYLPPLLAEERSPYWSNLSDLRAEIRGRPLNTDALLDARIAACESQVYANLLRNSVISQDEWVNEVFRTAMNDWDTHIRAGEPRF